jgi:hypothetical protein
MWGNFINGIGNFFHNPEPDLQAAATGLKNIGLGAVQDIAAPTWLGAEEIGGGYSPIAGVGSQAPLNKLQQYSQNNPFATSKQLQNMGGTTTQAMGQGAKDILGAESWMLPGMGMGGFLGRAGMGLAQGAIQGESEPNTTPSGVAASALTGGAINSLVPVAGNIVNRAVASSLGKGGTAILSLLKDLGPLKDLSPESLNNATGGLQDQANAMRASVGDVPIKEMFGGEADIAGIQNPEGTLGTMPGLENKPIPTQEDIANYTNQKQQQLRDLYQQHLIDNGTDEATAKRMANHPDATVPSTVLRDFQKNNVQKDAYPKTSLDFARLTPLHTLRAQEINKNIEQTIMSKMKEPILSAYKTTKNKIQAGMALQHIQPSSIQNLVKWGQNNIGKGLGIAAATGPHSIPYALAGGVGMAGLGELEHETSKYALPYLQKVAPALNKYLMPATRELPEAYLGNTQNTYQNQ